MPMPAVQCLMAARHVQPLRGRVLAGHDHVDVVPAPQAMVGHRKQAVGVRRQVDADHVRLLVDDVVDEARVLVGEAVVVLTPDVRREQVIQRGDGPPPGDLPGHLQPLGVLVEHRVNDVNERLVGVEQPVTAGQQVAFQPALAQVFAQHLHHAPLRSQVVVALDGLRRPLPLGDLEHGVEPVGVGFVRPEQAEGPRRLVALDHVAQEPAQLARVLRLHRPGTGHRDGVFPEVRHAQLDVLRLERLAEKWIVVQVDLPDREIVGGPPVGVHPPQEVRGKGFVHSAAPKKRVTRRSSCIETGLQAAVPKRRINRAQEDLSQCGLVTASESGETVVAVASPVRPIGVAAAGSVCRNRSRGLQPPWVPAGRTHVRRRPGHEPALC